MRSINAQNLVRSFTLAAGISLAGVGASYAQDAEPSNDVPTEEITETVAPEEAPNFDPRPIDVTIPENPSFYDVMEIAGAELGIPEEHIERYVEILAANMMRHSRLYIEEIEMEDLDRDIAAGMIERFIDRAETLAEAQEALAETNEKLAEIQAEYDALLASDTPDADALIELRDKVYAGGKLVERAESALERAQEYQNISLDILFDAGLDYALSLRDAHSDFLSPVVDAPRQRDGAGFVGIGAALSTDGASRFYIEEHIIVKSTLHPQDETPAAQAGLERDDLITHVNGTPVAGRTLDDVIADIKGAPGTDVNLSVIRDGVALEEPITVERGNYISKNTTYRIVDGDIGMIHINSYMSSQGAGADPMVEEDVRAAVAAIQEELGGVDAVAGYMISVRDNGGGSLTEVVDLLNAVIDGEAITPDMSAEEREAVLRRNSLVTTKGRNGLDDRFVATPGDITGGKPIVALTNGGSASASEIFAGTIQEMRGDVVGITSFGKGSVQIITGAPSGYGQNHFTVERYYYGPAVGDTQFGRSIQGIGVEPDVITPFVKAYDQTEAGLANAFATPEDANQSHDIEYSCTIIEDADLEALRANHEDFIDPRSGEFDFQAVCGMLKIRQRAGTLELSSTHEYGVEYSPYAP